MALNRFIKNHFLNGEDPMANLLRTTVVDRASSLLQAVATEKDPPSIKPEILSSLIDAGVSESNIISLTVLTLQEMMMAAFRKVGKH